MRLIILLIIGFFFRAGLVSAAEELHILSGAPLIPETVIERFERKSGLRLKVEYFESPEALISHLKTRPGGDLALLREHHLRHMVQERQVAELDHSLLPGLKNLSPEAFDNQADPGCLYSVPYAAGTFGIIYRRDLMRGEPNIWPWLFGQYAQNRPFALSNEYRDVMCAALLAQNYNCNSTAPQAIAQAAETLRELEKQPYFMGFLDDDSLSLYLKERIIYAASIHDSAAARVIADDPGLTFVTPQGGPVRWSFLFVINKQSSRQKAAHQWLEFILDPQVAAEISVSYSTATLNEAAWKLLPEAIRQNPVIYPPNGRPGDTVHMPLGLDDRSEKLYLDHWSRLKK